ncbi:MAG: right-handed parallel beta-helix repeat-containing protein [Candidatus Cloacimonadota bacterium]|nr:right-handed parallel beta-helix repeat-containing protein [Candidatus Cloacimonadota bacterium]
MKKLISNCSTFKTIIALIAFSLAFIALTSCDKSTTGVESNNAGIILDSITYQTIQEAIDHAIHGDTLFLTEGIYADDYDKNLTWDGHTKHITITTWGNTTQSGYAIIDCDGSDHAFDFSRTHQTEQDWIIGITIRNAGNNTYDSGIYCEEVSPNIIGCTIENNNSSGIYCDDASPLIEHCKIRNNKTGILCNFGAAPIIRYNYIENNNQESIYSIGQAHPQILNNVISGNKRGIHCLEYANSTIINNTIADNQEWGIKIQNPTSSAILNTIVWNNADCVVITDSVFISNCCLQESNTWSEPDSLENIYLNPQFIPSGFYVLQMTSPCINAGNNDYLNNIFEDIEGHSRIYDGTVDIGAYEWQPLYKN